MGPQVISWWITGLLLPRVLEVCLMVNFCCSGYSTNPIIWLSESWGRMGQAIDRTETESSAVLLCRAGHTVRQLNRCSAQGQPSLLICSLFVHSQRYFLFHLVLSMFCSMTIIYTLKKHRAAIGNGYRNAPHCMYVFKMVFSC